MTLRSTYFSVLFVLLCTAGGYAQNSCEYILDLFDSFGDGWNGSELTVYINDNDSTVYTLFNDENDSFNRFFLDITDGDIVRFAYTAGAFQGEVTYELLDPNCQPVFADGPFPLVSDTVFMDTLFCPTCLLIKESTVSVENVRHNRADVFYEQRVPDADVLIEYGLAGFVPGDGTTIVSPESPERITGLLEDTEYEVYLRNICPGNDTSDYLGPFAFRTRFELNVGVTSIVSPLSGCFDSAGSLIEFGITNFGGAPQTFIPLGVTINGIPQSINQPNDGVFTGVLGTDSTFIFKFDRLFDFTEPGDYTISVYTQFEDDSVIDNDTTTITIVSAPIIDAYPYSEDFEDGNGGWSVSSESVNSSWEFGMPDGSIINSAASGDNAWVTNLDGVHNQGELSYLISPCFDLSSFAEDPVLQFAFFLDMPTCCDEVWVETSTDGGNEWAKLGTDMTGINWYNDTFSDWWDGNGGVPGWHLVAHPLTGTAGESNVRVRIVMSGDFFNEREGAAVDNFVVSEMSAVDLAAVSASRPTDAGCGLEDDMVTLTVINLGTENITEFTANYQVNGGMIVSEVIDTVDIAPGEQFEFTFSQTFDSSIPGEYTVEAWVEVTGDGVLINDRAQVEFASAAALPYAEDFEGGSLPADWEADTDLTVGIAHNSPSFVLYDNIWQFDQVFNATTPAFGPIAEGDTLTFDYRYVQFSFPNDAEIIGEGDSLIVEVSTDCGMNFVQVAVITGLDHTPTTEMTNVQIGLDDFAGEAIRVRFRGIWGGGVDGFADYFLDIDNILVSRCVALNIEQTVQPASGQNEDDGAATLMPTGGVAPYTYMWSNGDATNTSTTLTPGQYQVTVTDAQGCSEVITVTVDFIVDAPGLSTLVTQARLIPNPTSQQTVLQIELAETTDLFITVHSSLGQVLQQYAPTRNERIVQNIDLQQAAAGLYYVRIRAGQEVHTLRLVKTQ